MRKHIFATALVALTLGLSAQAQQTKVSGAHYHWVDAKGLPHYSDSLTDDAVKYGYDVLNAQGMVMQHVQKQLSPQERVAAQKLAEQKATAQLAAQQRERDDMQLLNTYPDEASYKVALQQVLDSIDQQMSTTRINLHSQEAALTDLLNRAAGLENGKQPVPKFLTDRIASQRNVVAGQRATLARQQDQRDTAEQQQAQQLQHYRDLKTTEKNERGY